MALTIPTLEDIEAALDRRLEPLRLELARIRAERAQEGVTKAEAARRLHVSTRTIERRMADGTLPSVGVGAARRVVMSALLPEPE